MSSGSSTEQGGASRDSGFQPWHFYFLLSLAGATWAVIVSRHTHPAALLLLSAAILAAGLVGLALHHALTGFFGGNTEPPAMAAQTREFLEREKAIVLRSIKELEFDRDMRKVSDADFGELSARLRTRAMEIMQELDRPQPRSSARGQRLERERARAPKAVCASCQTPNDADARFCKNCGARL
jgi:zinc-ribbon domain